MACNLEKINECPRVDCPMRLAEDGFLEYMKKLKADPGQDYPDCIERFLRVAQVQGMRIIVERLNLDYRSRRKM